MEIALLIIVIALSGFCVYLLTEIQQLKKNPTDTMFELKNYTATKLTRFEKHFVQLQENQYERLNKDIKEYKGLVTKEINAQRDEQKTYTDKRIDHLNDKFFKVINLDS